MRRTWQRLFHAYVPKGAPTDIRVHVNPAAATATFRKTEEAALQADRDKEEQGFFALPRLDYDVSTGIPPLMSKKQFDVQYHVFHKDAVKTLNTHTLGSPLEGHSLEVVIRSSAFDATQAVVHTAACEHFNYCFWYKSLRPWGTAISSRLREELQLQYSRKGAVDAVEEVKRLIMVTALSHQERSGWVYLVWTGKAFDVLDFRHGTCPIGSDLIPLLALNVHASAYSIDYRAAGAQALEQYVRNFLKTCNWGIVDRFYFQGVQDRS